MDYRFIGWCKEGTSDKVWVCIQLTGDDWLGSYVTAWGRRGKKLQTKLYKDIGDWQMDKLIYSKEGKGYTNVAKEHLERVYPEFQEDLEKTAMWSMFKI